VTAGLSDLDQRGRLLVISPHYDDAVFSCEALLTFVRDVRVLTVFGGDAPHGAPLAVWDAQCGFGSETDVMACRRAEDARAMRAVNAEPIWGTELQESYRVDPPDMRRIVTLIGETLGAVNPSHVMFPMGLSHKDHLLVAAASIEAVRDLTAVTTYMYAEKPYAQRRPGIVRARRRELAAQGITLEPVSIPRHARRHDGSAIRCYGTQLRGLRISGLRMRLARERYWRTSRQGT
jgi:LmbE family N-acetylglucosaminyl deacetylase